MEQKLREMLKTMEMMTLSDIAAYLMSIANKCILQATISCNLVYISLSVN